MPSLLPRLHGRPVGAARFKLRPEDFQVEEVLGFDPSGEGEHCLLWIEKTGLNSNDVASHIAGRLGIRKRLVSHCGLKDRHAVTRQWFSLHLPGQASPRAEELASEGLSVLAITRNGRKLRRGSHDGNRFTIRLRECEFTDEQAHARWDQITARGVPNYFGPQRFGRDGGNVRQARRMFSGDLAVRDRALRGILISAARSFLFNAVLGERLERGSWDRVLEGEVFGFADNRSLVLPERCRGDEARAGCGWEPRAHGASMGWDRGTPEPGRGAGARRGDRGATPRTVRRARGTGVEARAARDATGSDKLPPHLGEW